MAQQQGESGESESINSLSLENDETTTSGERSKVDDHTGEEEYVRPGDPEVQLSVNDVEQSRRPSGAGSSESTCSCRVAPKLDPKLIHVRGLNPPDDKLLTITFHVLVHRPVWEWDDESQIRIRFGHPALGNWQCDCGPFKVGRKLDDELYEMIGEVVINSDLKTANLTYKYTVFSPKAETDDDCCEYLYDYGRSGNVSRCLQLSEKQYSPHEGTIHHYDTIAYPQTTKFKTLYKRTFGRATAAIKNLWQAGQQSEEDEEEEFRRLKLSQMCDICLNFYLEDCYKALSECSFECIPTLINKIDSVFYSLQSPLAIRDEDIILYNPQSQLCQRMKEWLESIIQSLKGIPDESRKLLSAVTIACCFFKFSRHCSKVDRFTVSVLEMLHLKPIVEASRCPDYELLCDALPKPLWGKAATCVHHLITCVLKSKEFKSPEWLAAIPLFHFLKRYSQPFEKPEMNPERICWGVREKELELDTLTAKSRPGFVDAHYNRLKPLFMADPLFLQAFIYLTPQKDFPVLFTKIPAYLSATWLSQKTNTMDSLNKVKACEWINWLCVLKEVIMKSDGEGDVKLFTSTVEASLLLCQKLAIKLTSPERHYVEVLGASISLFFFAIHHLINCPAYPGEVIKVFLDKLKSIVRQWIAHHTVIGGSFFGSNTELLRAMDEMQLWQILLVLECPSPQSTELWHNIAEPFIRKRTRAVVPEKSKIDLVTLLGTCEHVHPILTEAFIEAGMQALDGIFSKRGRYSSEEFEKLASTECTRVGSLLGAMMKKQYPHLNPGLETISVSFNELLWWNLWPNFIKLYEMETKLKEGLPQECREICVCAVGKMQQVCDQILRSEITMEELQRITKDLEQMQRLCAAATFQCKRKKKEEVKIALHQRLEEFEMFERRREHLHHLCSQLHIGVQGLDELKQELEINFNTAKIHKLCTREKRGTIRIHYFQSAEPLNIFAEKFYIMTRTYSSDIFSNIWKSTIAAGVKGNPSLTITDVCPTIWQPAFSHCQKLLDQLHEQSMELADIDRHFEQYNGPNLESQLMKTFQGINACSDLRHSGTWIKSIALRMNDYWSLCKYQDAANTFLLLRSNLCLTGDFRNVESLSTKVASSMKNQTLQSVNERLIETGQFLEDITLNPEKLQCLQTFARCREVIKWIREVTKSMSDLQTFVNVALSTAAGGEDDFARDRLSDLGTVGSGFGSLIYNLPKHAGYHELVQQCTLLWDAIQNNPLLPQILEGCNDALEWYKSVKETHGSVEVTSFGKLKHILTYGHFHIGSQSRKVIQSIHEIIHLKLLKTGKQLPQMSYSLDDLRDLESKLVLITGSKAKNREEVNQFLNTLHSVCRIADVLIALQQAGNVKYTGWVLSFSCVTDNFERLQALARDMENELQKWKDEVKEARGRFYELNYYTILQLLFLRSELGKLKGPAVCANVVQPTTLALLHGISPGITASNVVEKVSAVLLQQTRAKHTVTVGADLAFPTSQSLLPQDVVASDVCAVADHKKKGKENSARLATRCTPASIPPPADAPQAKLTQAELTDRQMEIFANLVDYCGFPSQLALLAIEQFGEDEYEMKNWCVENSDNFELQEEEDPEQEGSSCDTESVFEESESDEEIAMPFLAMASDGAKSSSPQFSITIRQPINESHPDVQSLVEAGFTAEKSIEAIELCDSVSAAMDYLMSSGNEEILQPTLLSKVDLIQLQPETEQKTIQCSEEKGFIVYSNENAENEYLSIHVLGTVLQEFSSFPDAVLSKRTFQTVLKAGQPNLLVTFPENVLKTTLSLYMENKRLPLPTHEEVLVCYPDTTAEEVILLCQRAFGDPGFKRIFCVAHAEKLSYQVCDKVLRIFTKLSHGKLGYRLVIICSNKEEQTSSIISKLQLFRRQYSVFADTPKLQSYLKFHFTREIQNSHQQCGAGVAASVDCEHSCVRVVASHRSGMGKSLYIRRMTSKLESQSQVGSVARIIIPIHGPVVSPDTVLDFLSQHTANSQCTIFHFDIAPGVLWKVDCILFCLLVLRGLSDSKGRIWRCHPSQLYAIEVTLPEFQDSSQESQALALLGLLPTVECVSPRRALELMVAKKRDPGIVLMDEGEFKSITFQRVYQYLNRHNRGINLDSFSYANTKEGNKADCLKIMLHYCGIHDPSWSEVLHFVHFLDLQLRSCEESVYCDETIVGDVMSGLKSFVVKFMIRMSRDFATSSLQGVVSRENKGQRLKVGGGLQHYEIVKRRCWENSSHPYIFFNQDRTTITFVGFTVTQNGDLIDPVHKNVLESAIMSKNLYTGLIQNKVRFSEDYRMWQKSVLIQKIGTVIGLELTSIKDPDPSYVLTVDNLIKILAIQMRFRCGIPVLIMGETGCGKTRLIRYMCDLAKQGKRIQKNMFIMKVHGGITEMDVIDFIQQAEEQARKNHKSKLDTVVFFDEANTTEAIGLIKEIVCDRRLHGKPLSPDLKFIAACNPYRKHTDEMIEKLESAGLGFHVRNTQQKLGQIPLRHLVYRVLDLPPSMRPLVYDFGQLNTDTERDYIGQMVSEHVMAHCGLSQSYVAPIAGVLLWSHQYMRKRQDECSFVSLRDIKRAMIVMEFFLDKMSQMASFGKAVETKAAETIIELEADDFSYIPRTSDNVTRSLVLALSVCYHARLQDRGEYEQGVAQMFTSPLKLEGAEQFQNEIRWCQEVLLDNMTLGPNIARNTALRENIFMMVVCVEMRIPLFLVGKPGSSKSLAKAIVSDSLQGQTSSNDLLKGFKQVHMFSYQCSQLSTPESVIEVFNTAKKFQQNQDTTKYVSVVVLDEVGLAEDSPNLPLKALHPLLEDGTEGADDSEAVIDREKRVAFIGISNWALDPAKMNRGVMVTRQEPDVQELELSAQGICSYKDNDPVRERLEGYFQPLAEAYKAICEQQKREFFGLRDFYSLIKMLYWLCEKSNRHPTWPQLEHVIRRNFGGLEDEDLNPLEEFRKRMPNRENPDMTQVPPELHSIVKPDSSPLGLIKTSLRTKEISWHGENRYLLFLTENYAALEILRHYLHDVVGTGSHADSTSDGEGRPERMDPFILFGSSFPKDKEYTQVCRNIYQIKICMETGRTAILLNLENLYESLYDLLNQYYIYHGGSKYVDLGLQTHRVKCRVHDNFKLILIAEKTTVYNKYPTPLINRLEKHFVLTSSVLTKWQLEVMEQLQEWAHSFSCVSGFKVRNVFIGYQKDTPATVVFQATNQLQNLKTRERPGDSRKWEGLEQASVLGNLQLDELMEEVEGSKLWKRAVFQLSQCLLLQTASPDAFARLKYTSLADQQELLWRLYDGVQHHDSLEKFLSHHLVQRSSEEGLLLQVTTHSHLLSGEELKQLGNILGYREHMSWFLLQEFDTELDFSSKVSPTFQRDEGGTDDFLLILQCDSGHMDGDLIACARYRIYDERAKSMMRGGVFKPGGSTHVLFVIYLPQQAVSSSFVGFQGDPWISTHIDDIRPRYDTITLCEAMKMPISHLFISLDDEHKLSYRSKEMPVETAALEEVLTMGAGIDDRQTGFPKDEPSVLDSQPKSKLPKKPGYFLHLHSCIQAAASRLQDSAKNKERATDRVKLLVDLIPRSPTVSTDNSTFHGILILHIYELLKERERVLEDESNWVVNEALSSKQLQSGGTFRNVITRKLDRVIVPIFAEIIALIDRNYNLDLADPSMPVFQFWLAMFRDRKVVQFIYTEMVVRKQVPGAGSRMAEEEFQCQFPFSWMVWEAFKAQWDAAKSTAGNNWGQLYTQLCVLVSETPIGEVLASVDKTGSEPFYQRYLHDFVRSVHKCNHRKPEYAEMEYRLIAKALSGVVHSTEVFSSISDHEHLTCRIAALHVIHQAHQSHILWFGLLASYLPGVLVTLEQRLPTDSKEMLLHLCAAERALEILQPTAALNKDDSAVHDWLNLLRLTQNAIAPILSFPSQHEIARKARLQWQLICVVHLFIKHIVSKYDGMTTYAKRLEMYLKTDPGPDFLKCSTIVKIKKHLNTMDAELQKKFKDNPKELTSIRRSCRAFFMELVSSLCFGATDPPEEELIQMLINTVFAERRKVEPEKLGTRDFNYREIDTDQIPTIRSFLLQLLLEHNNELVKTYLGDYFRRSQQALAVVNTADRDLYLLYTQCFEDSLYKRFITEPFHVRLTSATAMLEEARNALKMTSHAQGHALLNTLEGVAKARYGLSVVAILLNKQICGGRTDSWCSYEIIQKLLQETKTLCTDEGINHIDVTGDSDTTGPVVYLLKLLVRQYGIHCLQCVRETHQWVLPHELVQVEQPRDPFVLYDQSYSRLRQSVTEAIIEKRFEQIFETLEGLSSQEKPLLLLAFYSLSRTNATYSRKIQPAELNEVGKTIAKSKVLSKELQWMGRVLLANEQGGPLAQLTVTSKQTPLQQTLGSIVVHTAAVLLCRQGVGLLKPFVNMLCNPTALVNTYLPTMPEDLLPEAKKALGGKFYECPRGHPYLVTECGRPVQQYQCPVCGSKIGGISYKLEHDNRIIRSNDQTQTGYCLGQAEGRSSVPAPERSLSPVACCILRVLMHSALLWASCNYQSEMKGLLHLVKPHLNSAELPQFFWLHLEKDLELLEQATGKSVDEVAIIVHLVLRGILTRGDTVRVASDLKSRGDRDGWEKEFKRVFIAPVLEKMEESVAAALDLIINDNKQDHLLYLIYEKIPVVEGSLNPHLWTYRSRITVEYLSQTLQQQGMGTQYPILYHFLKEEHTLRATQYLPDIVRMQRLLYDTFHHRLDRKDAKHITIGQFLRERKSGNVRSEYQRMVESLQRAWQLVGDQLRDHARLRVDNDHLLPTITEDTPLEYLIPTTTGAGAITTALVDFLVLTHNNFIEKCRGIVADQEERLSKSPLSWQNHPVLLPHVHRCHLLGYENQLHSIILSHCQYSLVVGSGQKICYDWPALEQHILGRFIHGKPLIQCDIPQVEYKKDIYTVATFDAIRKKVNPQVQLDSQIKHEIVQELYTVNRVREALDVVNIVMGFLSSGGGKADRQLGEYITRTLRISKKKRFSEKAHGKDGFSAECRVYYLRNWKLWHTKSQTSGQIYHIVLPRQSYYSSKARKHCTLGHILSLWETLSVELARQIVLSGQDPFDSVKEKFSKDLSSKGQQSQTRALDRCLRSFNLDQLLEALYALIETHIKYCPDNEKDWLLVNVLDPFLQNNHLAPIPHFSTEFPSSIILAQTVAVWKHIVLYNYRNHA